MIPIAMLAKIFFTEGIISSFLVDQLDALNHKYHHAHMSMTFFIKPIA